MLWKFWCPALRDQFTSSNALCASTKTPNAITTLSSSSVHLGDGSPGMLLDHKGFRMEVGEAQGTPGHWLSYTSVTRLKWASQKDLSNSNVVCMEPDDGKGSEKEPGNYWQVIGQAWWRQRLAFSVLVGNLHPSFCCCSPVPSQHLLWGSGPHALAQILHTYCVALLEPANINCKRYFQLSQPYSFLLEL